MKESESISPSGGPVRGIRAFRGFLDDFGAGAVAVEADVEV